MLAKQEIKVLLITSDESEIENINNFLAQTEQQSIKIETSDTFTKALKILNDKKFDVIMLDLDLPDTQGISTFVRMRTEGPDIPIILFVEKKDREIANEAIHEGALDYFEKRKLSGELLVRVFRYAVERYKMLKSLQVAVDNLKNLRGLLPICAWCKNIRDDKGYWSKVESYITYHSEADFTHSICPACKEKMKAKKKDEA